MGQTDRQLGKVLRNQCSFESTYLLVHTPLAAKLRAGFCVLDNRLNTAAVSR